VRTGDEVLTNTFVRLPLKTFNRHGLIAGATGTGKTKTLQIIAEQLSLQGVPSLVMDVKGDLSGIARPAEMSERLIERHDKIGLPFIPGDSPVEFLSLSDEKGLRLRATVTEFGPILFSKILGLNEVQSGIVSVVFKYCDDKLIPVIDLRDFRMVLQYVNSDGKEEFERLYGKISSVSLGTILRKIVELEHQGAELFFGEPSFEVDDLLNTDEDGRGVISILRLTDLQNRPKLFSTFMLQLLAEVYDKFPEIGDPDKPKLVIFIDEAHLVFDQASRALLNQIDTIIKLIRSKGVGVFFITQLPTDIPDSVLSQLGMKIQHSLRAFTARDRKAIQKASENYPVTQFYKVSELMTGMGIGEALVTALNEKGLPTELAYTYLRAPHSRMDILSDEEIDDIIAQSKLAPHYGKRIDRETAYDILTKKLERAQSKNPTGTAKPTSRPASRSSSQGKNTFEMILRSPAARQFGNTVARELTRTVFGILGINKRR
jgi:DNA helicase HerA-like ATPase